MPAVKKDFDSYKISFESQWGIYVAPIIYLFNKGQKVGEIDFYRLSGEIDWAKPPVEALHKIEADYITINLELGQFDSVCSLLRSETNLEIYMRPTTSKAPGPWTAIIRMKSEKAVGGK